MRAEDFIATKQANWQQLSMLVAKSRRIGLAALSAEEITELGRLYRGVTSDLAIARRDFAGHRVSDYLNGLVAQAHAVVYQSRSNRAQSLFVFFTHTFPRAFRATWAYTLASFLMFFIPTLISFAVTFRDPAAASTLVPGIDARIQDIREQREWWKEINDDGRTASAALIATNNIRVAIIAFAGGMLLGTLTLYILVQNGLLFGTVAGAAQALGFAGNLWGFVAGHGTIELSVIFIAGGAGLQLGWSVLRPGLLSRGDALRLAAQRAAHLLLGCVPLLLVAGLIESFVSPSALPLWVKLAVSLGSGVLLYGYLLLSGREHARRRAARSSM